MPLNACLVLVLVIAVWTLLSCWYAANLALSTALSRDALQRGCRVFNFTHFKVLCYNISDRHNLAKLASSPVFVSNCLKVRFMSSQMWDAVLPVANTHEQL